MRSTVSLLLSIVMLITPAAPLLAQEEEEPKSLLDCDAEGKRASGDISTTGSFFGGLAGGLFLGLIGTGIAVVVQSEPQAPYYQLPEDDNCSYAFQQGYANKGKSNKRSAALQGGLLGTAVLVVVLVVSQSGGTD